MYAEIYWLTPEEGGRKTPIYPNPERALSYWANTQTRGGSAWSVGVYFGNKEPVQMGTTGRYEIKFLTPEGREAFKSGDVLHVCEGSKIVGRGAIL